MFTRVTACTLALPPYFAARFTEGFNRFVTSTVAPVASGWSSLPGGTLTHWESAALTRRTPAADVHPGGLTGQVHILAPQPDASVTPRIANSLLLTGRAGLS